MNEQEVLAEIRRTAAENGGKPLGRSDSTVKPASTSPIGSGNIGHGGVMQFAKAAEA
jgi:hypothetical protein